MEANASDRVTHPAADESERTRSVGKQPTPVDWLNELWTRAEWLALTPMQRLVLLTIYGFVSHKTMAWTMSFSAIAKRAGVGRATVARCVSHLATTELVAVSSGHRQANTYRLKLVSQGDQVSQGYHPSLTVIPPQSHCDTTPVSQRDSNQSFLPVHLPVPLPKEGLANVSETSQALAFASSAAQLSGSERAIVARACTAGGVDIEIVGPEAIDAIGKCAKILGRVWPIGFSLNSRGDCTVHHLVRAIGVEIATEGGTVGSACTRIAKAATEQSAACTRAFGKGWQTDPERFVVGIDKWLDQGRWRMSPENAVRAMGGLDGSWVDEYARKPVGGA